MRLGEWWEQLRAREPTLRALMRPELGRTPQRLRRWLEPVVAVLAALALVVLAGTGGVAGAILFMALALAYLLLTHVFGLHLELNQR